MELLLKVINKPHESNYTESFQFGQQGGNIGRDSNCSWILSDIKREIEDVHIEIVYASGHFFLKDVSKKGLFYTKTHAKVPSYELVRLKEADQITLGPYDILVHFVKEQAHHKVIDDFLNQREIDVSMDDNTLLHKEHDSPVNIILKEKALDKDILSYVNLIPEEEDPFESIEKSETVLTEHISAPSFQEPHTDIPQPSVSTRQSDLLINILFNKLGLDRNQLDSNKEAYIIAELAESMVVALESMDRIADNIDQTAHALKLPIAKRASMKTSLQAFYDGTKTYRLSEAMRLASENVLHHQTALYQSIVEVEHDLSEELSPKSVYQQEQSFIPLRTQTNVARYYRERYQYLDQEHSTERLIISKLKAKYNQFMQTLSLVKK